MTKNKIDDAGPTEEQFKEMLQQGVLKHYPNPERKGCLDSMTLQDIAQQRLPHEDERWGHISHCSPCYREFLDNRNRFLEERMTGRARKRAVIAITVIVAVGAMIAAILIVRSH